MENEITAEESTRALEMLTHIEANPDINQLTLANELGVAVGTINWHLKRMIAKGYVKVKRAQRKKLRYIITPEGIALRAALTVDYIKNSFNLYRQVRERTNLCLQQLQDAGYESVNVLGGEDEVAEVVRLTCLEQGVEVTDDAQVPTIHIEGIKIALKLPEAAQTDTAAEEDKNRGDHG
ncbi:MAG: winged helix-turn-helix transcriptional regulator [Anaerolineaceae bacterium]|jgi:DNA-binding MarR family transcriptional regulator|nr:winged helix-turn-helix transcriptional regulator [Anaerolineaceae bacterium]MDD4043299.1 winged helix-turn-helix transcriptional regulator [Anaerolineaceae bacterium]MDD4577197.1 winged helix-turn-helix transcriptional regulator [Anaerolineaceae bacterium]